MVHQIRGIIFLAVFFFGFCFSYTIGSYRYSGNILLIDFKDLLNIMFTTILVIFAWIQVQYSMLQYGRDKEIETPDARAMLYKIVVNMTVGGRGGN